MYIYYHLLSTNCISDVMLRTSCVVLHLDLMTVPLVWSFLLSLFYGVNEETEALRSLTTYSKYSQSSWAGIRNQTPWLSCRNFGLTTSPMWYLGPERKGSLHGCCTVLMHLYVLWGLYCAKEQLKMTLGVCGGGRSYSAGCKGCDPGVIWKDLLISNKWFLPWVASKHWNTVILDM